MRLFVAIELRENIREALAAAQRALSRFDRTVRWMPPDRIHLTLKFLGEVEESRMEAVQEACRTVARQHRSFELSLTKCGCFPPRGRVNIVWTGVRNEDGMLAECHTRCEEAFEALNWEREQRAFTPHLTIGRVRDDHTGGELRKAVEGQHLAGACQMVEELVLMQSLLGRGGSEYRALERIRLGSATLATVEKKLEGKGS